MSVHRNLAVRFYPGPDEWTCVVQRLGGDGMPLEPDVVTATGASKAQAVQAAIDATEDPNVREALEEHKA